VNDVSFDVNRGETLGLVGESGCGKTTLGLLILHLLDPDSGSVMFEGRDVTALSGSEMRALRKRMQIVFQDPNASLNPRLTIDTILREPLRVHRIVPKEKENERIAELMAMVGLDPRMSRRFPHEFSSGQRQRIGIARALSVEPEFMICDEPVSALDVSVQAQILNLLLDLKKSLKLTLLFITHDLAVVRHISDRIAVMYLGRIVELGNASEICSDPLHPYTTLLMHSSPSLDPANRKALSIGGGELPKDVDVPSGCPFHPRCESAMDVCAVTRPVFGYTPEGRLTACHLHPVSAEAYAQDPVPAVNIKGKSDD
jgi:oligopeptide transport system ATP-binding protein